jgi:hypothetical protein
MNAYKYRGGNFDRDIRTLEQNYFFAPNSKELNDPCEALVFTDSFESQLSIFGKVFKIGEEKRVDFLKTTKDFIQLKNKIGIFSLSQKYDDELLWAHYANNHKGFCIEYDLELLADRNIYEDHKYLNVKYSNKPPQLELSDLSSKDNTEIYKKIVGTKSQRWNYEEEIRLITNDFGEHDYDFRAVKAIYFGLRMPNEEKDEMMSRLSGRQLKHYQIHLDEKNYRFYRVEVGDKYSESKKYLFEFEGEIKTGYKLLEYKYSKVHKKGILSVQLQTRITKDDLFKLGNELKEKLFRKSEIVYIFYHLADQINADSAWGITHFRIDKVDVNILGLTISEEEFLKELIINDKRDVIGHWIDDSFAGGLLTLFKDNDKIFLETFFKDQSKIISKQKISNVSNGQRYDDEKQNSHGEYIIVDKICNLNYHSPEGIFKILKPYK